MKIILFFMRLIERATATLLGLCIGAVFLNVILRYGFDSGLVFTEEVSRIILIWIVFLGAIVALHTHQHIGMTMLIDRAPVTVRKVSAFATAVLMLLCDVLLVSGSYQQAQLSMQDSYPVTGLPLSVIYWPGMVAGSLFAGITLSRIVLVLRGRLSYEKLFCAASEEETVAVTPKPAATERA